MAARKQAAQGHCGGIGKPVNAPGLGNQAGGIDQHCAGLALQQTEMDQSVLIAKKRRHVYDLLILNDRVCFSGGVLSDTRRHKSAFTGAWP